MGFTGFYVEDRAAYKAELEAQGLSPEAIQKRLLKWQQKREGVKVLKGGKGRPWGPHKTGF